MGHYISQPSCKWNLCTKYRAVFLLDELIFVFKEVICEEGLYVNGLALEILILKWALLHGLSILCYLF